MSGGSVCRFTWYATGVDDRRRRSSRRFVLWRSTARRMVCLPRDRHFLSARGARLQNLRSIASVCVQEIAIFGACPSALPGICAGTMFAPAGIQHVAQSVASSDGVILGRQRAAASLVM